MTDTLTASGLSSCGVSVTNALTSSCVIVTAPVVAITAICPTAPILPGSLLAYSGTVHNGGNITLTNVTVLSDRPVPNTSVFTVATLAPGETANFSSSLTVPANACSVATTFSVVGKDYCTLNSVTNTIITTCTVTTAPGIAVSLLCPAVSPNAGSLITYTGTVRNSGNVTLNNVFVVNNHPLAASPVIGPISLAPGAVAPFTASFTAPLDACSVSTTVKATGADSCTALVVTDAASATCTLITTPGIIVTQVCPVIPTVPGGVLTYSGTVRNSGDVTLANIAVLNNLSGSTPIFTLATLAPGASANFTGSFIASTNCSMTDTLTASAVSSCGAPVSNAATSTCVIVTAPVIAVAAVCPTAPVLPGSNLIYSGTVRNGGNITLTNVIVMSDRPAANTTVFTIATLAPGAVANFTSSVTVPTNACSVATTFTGTGLDLCSLNTVTNKATTTCTVTTAPSIAVSLLCPAVSPSVGGLIAYTGTVRNSGNVTLNNVFVVSNHPLTNSPVIGPITLAPGEATNFIASFTAPLDACSVTTAVIATGADNCTALVVSNTASATCTLITAPSLAVGQLCPTVPVVPGAILTYDAAVRNSGNVTLLNIVVLNSLSGSTPVFTLASLAPGASIHFPGSFVAPTNCSVTDTLTATATSTCGAPVSITSTTTCPVLTRPDISVTQVCPTNSVLQGGILTYTGTVMNIGNIFLTNVIVMSDRPGSNTVIFTQNLLAPGASAHFSGSYQVPLNCCVVSSTVLATGQSCAGVTVSDTFTRTCTVLTLPALSITKICVPGELKPGSLLAYSGAVSNSGNITLIGVTVVNSETPNAPPILGPLTLAPGESFPYTASYIVPKNFCGTDTVTAEGLNVCTLLPVSSSVTTTCPVVTPAAKIAVTQNCPETPTPRGGLYTFTGTVSNPGEITLLNVYVVNNQLTNNTPVIGPIDLAPGEVVHFSGSYIAPRCCCLVIDTLTARGTDKCSGEEIKTTTTTVCPLLTTPIIGLLQDCPANPLVVGSNYAFSGYVTNSGDVVLTNVFVFSPSGTNSPVLGPIELAPGESEYYSGNYLVTAAGCGAVFTASGADVCGGRVVTGTVVCPVDVSPLAKLSISESCPPGPVRLGTTVVFTGIISNSGNVTLTNVIVFSGLPNNGSILGPIDLAPGGSAPFTGSYAALTGSNLATNSVAVTNNIGVITTNRVVTLTPANTLVATGMDHCDGSTIIVAADCLGPVTAPPLRVLATPAIANNAVTLSFPTISGQLQKVQYKNSLNDASWTDLQTVTGTGASITLTDPGLAQHPSRFYRIVSAQ